MKTMTKEQLQAIRERAEQATPPPWKTWGMQVLADPKGASDLKDGIPVADTHYRNAQGSPRAFDANFIAAARQDVPDLLAHIAEMEAKASGWQPIETAPKNGTPVDLWARNFDVGPAGIVTASPGERFVNARWGNEEIKGSILRPNDFGWVYFNDYDIVFIEYNNRRATHWQPLPAPPAPAPNEKETL